MLFDDAPRPKLLDVVDVGVDKNTGFDERPLIGMAPGDDALVTYSEHSNSNQSYMARLLILVRGDRFQLIDELSLFSDDGCGWRREEVPAFATKPARGSPYRELDVTVMETLKHPDEDCGDDKIPRAYSHIWRGAWRWDAHKGAFTERLHQLDRLDKLNEGRF
jgi:hypothetical protein